MVHSANCKIERLSSKVVDYHDFDHFVYSSNIWTPLGLFETIHVQLKELIEESGSRCQDFESVSITVHNSTGDIFRSLLPLASSKTIEITGIRKIKKAFAKDGVAL